MGFVYLDRDVDAAEAPEQRDRLRCREGQIERTEIGLLERGERVARIDTAIKLAGGVGVPLCELLDGLEWKPGTMQAGTFSVPAEQDEAPEG